MTTDVPSPIVVGVDGGPAGVDALRWGLGEGDRRDCAVRAVLVAATDAVQQLVDTVGAVLGDHDDPRLSAEVVGGAAGEALCAASAGAQLLVLGSVGCEPVLGSVARYCLRHAACPVVLVPGVPVPEVPAPRPLPRSHGQGTDDRRAARTPEPTVVPRTKGGVEDASPRRDDSTGDHRDTGHDGEGRGEPVGVPRFHGTAGGE